MNLRLKKVVNELEFYAALNLVIRLLVMAVKYFVVLTGYTVLVKKEFVDFSIIVAFLNFSVLVIGLDIYQVSQRKHITADMTESARLFYSEIVTGMVLALLALLSNMILNADFMFALNKVILITLFDFILLSVSRFLLVKKTFLSSTIVSSLRSLPHLLLIIYFRFYSSSNKNLSSVVDIWFYTAFISSLSTLLIVSRYLLKPVIPKVRYVLSLLSRKSFLYWFCSISTYFLLFVDKKILNSLGVNERSLATYSFFFSLYSFLPAFIDAFLITPRFKLILQEINGPNMILNYRALFIKAIRLIVLCTIFSLPIVIVLIEYYPALNDGLYFLFAPLLFFSFYAISYVPNTFLYAKQMDADFFRIHIFQFLFFLISSSLSFLLNSYILFITGYIFLYFYIFYAKHKRIISTSI